MNARSWNEVLLAGAERVRKEGIQVYLVGDCDWIAAESPEDAIAVMAEYYEDGDEYTIEDVEELTPHKLDTLQYWVDGTESGQKRNFRTELYRLAGEGFDFPRHFATTEI